MERRESADRASRRARRRAARIACLAVGVAACAGPEPSDPARRCAGFVKSYRGLEGAVEVVGTPAESSEGTVAIRWRGSDAMSVPVEGSAECTFAVGGGGELTLLEASVDGAPVDAAAIEADRGAR